MNNGTHTSKKRRSAGKPHIYFDNCYGEWLYESPLDDIRNYIAHRFCYKMDSLHAAKQTATNEANQ